MGAILKQLPSSFLGGSLRVHKKHCQTIKTDTCCGIQVGDTEGREDCFPLFLAAYGISQRESKSQTGRCVVSTWGLVLGSPHSPGVEYVRPVEGQFPHPTNRVLRRLLRLRRPVEIGICSAIGDLDIISLDTSRQSSKG